MTLLRQIVMEYCGAGSIADVINVCGKTFSEDEIADVCASMLLGLAYLHTNHNIHRVGSYVVACRAVVLISQATTAACCRRCSGYQGRQRASDTRWPRKTW